MMEIGVSDSGSGVVQLSECCRRVVDSRIQHERRAVGLLGTKGLAKEHTAHRVPSLLILYRPAKAQLQQPQQTQIKTNL